MERFYSIISQNSTSETAQGLSTNFVVQINPNHVVFKGHFPGMPIVPGVFFIQLTQELLEEALKQKIKLEAAQSIKFLTMIVPDNTNELTVVLLFEKSEKIKLMVEIKDLSAKREDNNSTCFKMTAEYNFE